MFSSSTNVMLCRVDQIDREKNLIIYSKIKDLNELAYFDPGSAARDYKAMPDADVRTVAIAETDLLFIDTWHVYAQLKEELRLHAGKAASQGHLRAWRRS